MTGKRPLPIEPIRLADLVSYQEGAIVSRTLLERKTGTVTLFAFDEGQRLSEHTTPYDALVYVLDGVAEIIVEGKAHTLSTGEVLRLPANRPHAVRAVERCKMLLIMVRS